MANTKEKDFQSSFLKEVREKFPGCFILKNDSGYMQGVPDWLILYKDKWAMIEMKKSADATHRPNQDWYVNQLNQMGYCTFAYPENREEVMNDLERTFEAEG